MNNPYKYFDCELLIFMKNMLVGKLKLIGLKKIYNIISIFSFLDQKWKLVWSKDTILEKCILWIFKNVKPTLEKTLDILIKSHSGCKKQTYHAKTFHQREKQNPVTHSYTVITHLRK